MKFRLSFNFNQIERAPLGLEGTAPADCFDISDDELVSFGDVRYELLVSPISGGAMLTGWISARTTRRCVRCLRSFDFEIPVRDLSHFYKKEDDREFDLIPDLREDILLASPSNLACAEGCRGLCPSCGADLNDGDCGCRGDDPPASGAWDGLDGLKVELGPAKKTKGASHGKSKKKKV